MTYSLTGLGQAMGRVRRWLGCVALLGLLVPMVAGAARLAEPYDVVREVV